MDAEDTERNAEARIPSMRTHTRETLALLWQGRWDVVKTALMVPVLFIATFILFPLIFSMLGDGMIVMALGILAHFVTMFMVYAYAPAVLLYSLAQRARGDAVSYGESIKAVLKRLPQLVALSWQFLFHYIIITIVIGVVVTMAFVFAAFTALGPEQFEPTGEMLSAISGVTSAIASFFVLALLVRWALVAPALIVADGMDARPAWNRSIAVMTWRRSFAAAPFYLPLIANSFFCIAVMYPPVMREMGGMLWLSLMILGYFALTPLCLMIAAAGSVIPWRDTLNEPDGPKPKAAPQPLPPPTHDLPTSGIIP